MTSLRVIQSATWLTTSSFVGELSSKLLGYNYLMFGLTNLWLNGLSDYWYIHIVTPRSVKPVPTCAIGVARWSWWIRWIWQKKPPLTSLGDSSVAVLKSFAIRNMNFWMNQLVNCGHTVHSGDRICMKRTRTITSVFCWCNGVLRTF